MQYSLNSLNTIPQISCVYILTNTLNKKVYIGKTVNLYSRFRKHLSEIASSDQVLYRAIRKYGLDAFTLETVVECDEDSMLLRVEIEQIRLHDCKVPKGYNMTDGGEGMAGHVQSELTKANRRKAALDNPERWQAFAKYVTSARSENHRNNISLALRGRPTSSLGRFGADSFTGKAVIVYELDSFTGRYFSTCKEAASHYKVDNSSITNWAKGRASSKLGLVAAFAI